MSTLFCRNGRSDSLVLEGRLAGGDCVAVTVTDGVISSIAPAAATPHVLAPAFVDPHVHLRSPGREDEETIASGTAAAAAGGYCAILAMPNTDPVVDSAAVLGSLVETARREALVPTGFMAAISKRLGGEELTEMGELADAGAAAFTDDGRPVTSAGLMRRALQYGVGHRPHARAPLRGADALPRRPGARGRGLRRARLRPVPVARRERHGRARPLAGRLRVAPAAPDAPLGEGVGGGAAPRARARREGHRRGDAASPRPHRRGGSLARPEREDEPAAASRRRSASADRRAPGRHDRLRRHRPRAALARGEGGAVRGGALRRHRARDVVRCALHPPRPDRASSRSRRCSSACPAARHVRSACRSRRSRSAPAPTSSCSTSSRSGR